MSIQASLAGTCPHPSPFSHTNLLPEIDSIQSQATKLSAYTSLLDTLYINSRSPHVLTTNLTSFLDAILAESVSLVITRPVLADFVARLESIQDIQARKEVLTFALEKVHPRAVSFEEQASAIREKLADIYEEEGDHKAAARALQGIMLESGQRYVLPSPNFSSANSVLPVSSSKSMVLKPLGIWFFCYLCRWICVELTVEPSRVNTNLEFTFESCGIY